jgi:putative transposase
VQKFAHDWLADCLNLKDHGRKCTAKVVINILLLAAAGICSLHAICKKLSGAPSSVAMFDALRAMLPSLAKLERNLNNSLRPYGRALKSLQRKMREVAFDITLLPYHGEPYECVEEIYRSLAKNGTSHFHAYATAYVIQKGHRYTLGLTRVLAGEKMEEVVKRLVDIVRSHGIRIKLLLLDRGFFSVKVMRALRAMRCPFLMPVVMRGRKKLLINETALKAKETTLRQFLKKKNGWYSYQMKSQKAGSIRFDVCVASKKYFNKKDRKHNMKKMVYAVWGVKKSPMEIRELYRKRFGIETSYRQMNQARIRTTTRDPLLRLLFVGIAFILLNVWVWLHDIIFSERCGMKPTRRLHKLRFREMLQWIEQIIEPILHNGKNYTVQIN